MTALASLPHAAISQVVAVLDEARIGEKTVFIFGNGGSAATASHFACDLAKGAICPDKPRFKVLSLTDNIPVFSAWANDSAYDRVFAEQLENFVGYGDVIIAISGSGNSRNVLDGVEVANAKGAITIGFTGFDGGKLKDLVDIPLVVPNYVMEQVEDIHLLLEHIITTCLRNGGSNWRPVSEHQATNAQLRA
jgi:D-sedoheptulose 7-phosphate isomerase